MASKKREHVVQLVDGVWYRLGHGKPPYEHQCCRCGLRHSVEFKYEQGSVWEKWTVLPDEKPKRAHHRASPFTNAAQSKRR